MGAGRYAHRGACRASQSLCFGGAARTGSGASWTARFSVACDDPMDRRLRRGVMPPPRSGRLVRCGGSRLVGVPTFGVADAEGERLPGGEHSGVAGLEGERRTRGDRVRVAQMEFPRERVCTCSARIMTSMRRRILRNPSRAPTRSRASCDAPDEHRMRDSSGASHRLGRRPHTASGARGTPRCVRFPKKRDAGVHTASKPYTLRVHHHVPGTIRPPSRFTAPRHEQHPIRTHLRCATDT